MRTFLPLRETSLMESLEESDLIDRQRVPAAGGSRT